VNSSVRASALRFYKQTPATGRAQMLRRLSQTLYCADGTLLAVHAGWARVPALLNAESRSIHGRVCFRGSRRQGEVKRRAAPAVVVGPDPSAL
jgi:hypothetical protein